MQNHPEFPKYREELAQCNRVFGVLGTIYIVFACAYILALIPMFFLSMSLRMSFVSFILCAVLCIPSSIALGYYSVYRKHQFAAVLAIFPVVVGVFFASHAVFIGFIDVVLIPVSIVSAILVTIYGKNYHFLEQQEGFPHFSELHTENVRKADSAAKADPYARKEEFYASEDVRGKMDELPDISEAMQAKADVRNNYMDEI